MRLSHKMFMIACMASAAFVAPAYAQEEEVPAVVQALLDNLERQSAATVKYDSVEEADNGDVTLTNLTVTRDAKADEPTMGFKVASLSLTGVSEEDTGYLVAKTTFSNMTFDVGSKEFTFNGSAPDGSVEGWHVRELGDDATPKDMVLASSTMAKSGHVGKLTFTAMGQSVTVDSIDSTWDGDASTGSGKFTTKISNIAIPESVLAAADQMGMLKQLGYTSLSFDVNADGSTNVTDTAIDYVMNIGLAGKDIANLKFGVAANGIPLAVFAEMQKAQKEGKEPDFNALMPELQNISFSGASVRFEDASITKKVLPMIAAMQGMDEKTMVASVGPMLQMGLMQLQNEAFAKQAMDAVTGFLNDPKSITVSFNPAAPVKVSDFAAMNPNAPGEAITKLGVTVSAND